MSNFGELNRADLDDWITGHWGEDQFRDDDTREAAGAFLPAAAPLGRRTMAEFTPGPWRVHAIAKDEVWSDGKPICHAARHSGREGEANMVLISAAPDLLAACEAVEHNLSQRALCSDDLTVLRAAIAKARGK